MRSEEETMAAIMEIKFCNVVVELLIEYHDDIFHTANDNESAATRFYLRTYNLQRDRTVARFRLETSV